MELNEGSRMAKAAREYSTMPGYPQPGRRVRRRLNPGAAEAQPPLNPQGDQQLVVRVRLPTDLPYSKYQLRIFEWIRRSRGSAIVQVRRREVKIDVASTLNPKPKP